MGKRPNPSEPVVYRESLRGQLSKKSVLDSRICQPTPRVIGLPKGRSPSEEGLLLSLDRLEPGSGAVAAHLRAVLLVKVATRAVQGRTADRARGHGVVAADPDHVAVRIRVRAKDERLASDFRVGLLAVRDRDGAARHEHLVHVLAADLRGAADARRLVVGGPAARVRIDVSD